MKALAFAAPLTEIHVHSEIDLRPHLQRFLCGWPARVADPAREADVRVAASGEGYRLSTGALPADELLALNPADAVNHLASVLARLAAIQLGGHGELHASAVEVGGRAVLMPGPSMCGKTTLALQLAMRGHRLYGDDRVLVGPLAPDRTEIPGIVALGLTPRARRPVHPAAGPEFAAFVAGHAQPIEGDVAYLSLDEAIAARFGDRAPVAAIVLPERRDGGGIDLRDARATEAVRMLVEQIHAPDLEATALLAIARRMAGLVPVYRLAYDNSAAAAQEIARLAMGN